MIREQYGTMCFQLAYRIIRNKKDAEEYVNDMLPAVWDTIPPLNPEKPVPYLAALTSRTAINQYKRMHNQKRGSTQFSSALEELAEIIPSPENAVATSLSVISGDNEPTCSAEQLALADVVHLCKQTLGNTAQSWRCRYAVRFFVRLYENDAAGLTPSKEFSCKMTENMQVDALPSRQACFVRCCLYH